MYSLNDNGQPVKLKPRGLNDFGLPFDQPGPIVLNNEPERSLRPGEVFRIEHDDNDGTAHKIEITPVYVEPEVDHIPMSIMQKRLAELAQLNLPENVIHNILTDEFGDGYYRRLWNNGPEYNKDGSIKEGVKDGYNGAMKFDTGDDKERTRATISDDQTHALEFSNEYPTIIDNTRYYDKSYYDLANDLDQPELGMKLRDLLQMPSVWLHKFFPNISRDPRNANPLDLVEFEPSTYNRQNAMAECCMESGTEIPEEYKTVKLKECCMNKPIKLTEPQHKFLSEYGFAKDSDPQKYNSECQECGEPRDSPLHILEIKEAGESPAFPNKTLHIREMRHYVYVNKGKKTPYNEKQVNHICAMLADTVWDSKDPHRPILPSEGSGYTNTHPNCQCKWDKFTIIDDSPEKIAMPTRNGQPLANFAWKGRAIERLVDTNISIQNKMAKGELRPLDDKGRIQETVQTLKHEFKWMSPEYFGKLKDTKTNGKFLLIRATQAALTDHRHEGEQYKRFLSPNELHAMARTAILSYRMDVNHDTPLRDPDKRRVMDSEFDPTTQSIQMLVHEDDEEILRAIEDGTIDAVSINAGQPREQPLVCKDAMCTEKVQEPRGMVLGERDGISLTYVVTNPKGFFYNGRYIPPAEPGVKTTAIQILDNN